MQVKVIQPLFKCSKFQQGKYFKHNVKVEPLKCTKISCDPETQNVSAKDENLCSINSSDYTLSKRSLEVEMKGVQQSLFEYPANEVQTWKRINMDIKRKNEKPLEKLDIDELAESHPDKTEMISRYQENIDKDNNQCICSDKQVYLREESRVLAHSLSQQYVSVIANSNLPSLH